jgi:hypothetical protein
MGDSPVRTSTDQVNYGKPQYKTIYMWRVYNKDDPCRVYTHTGVLNLVHCRLGHDGTSRRAVVLYTSDDRKIYQIILNT